MSSLKSAGWAAALLCAAWLPAARAGDWGAAPVVPSLLQISIVYEPVPNLPPVPRACVTTGTNQFAFVVPEGFRVDASNPETILLTQNDYSCFLTLRIASPAPADPSDVKPDFCRALLSSRFPGAKISEAFSLAAANHSGPAFNLQWTNASGVAQSARVAFIPSAAGLLEFSLVASPGKFSGGQPPFNSLLLTFRTNEGGKLEILPLPGNS